MSRVFSRRAFALISGAGLLSWATGRQSAHAQSIYNNSGYDQPGYNHPDLVSLLGSAADSFQTSLDSVCSFLNSMDDAYATGSTVRLVQSYSDQQFAAFPHIAFTYDNAVTAIAYLARGTSNDIGRASVIGDGLIHAQATNFPVNDGRFAQAYYVNTPDSTGAYITPAANPFYFYSSSTGDQAWAGMALSQLYNVTRKSKYLTAALLVGNWIATNTYCTVGAGGYRFGSTINSSNRSVASTNGKSTEHNIDTCALFTMLAQLTSDARAHKEMKWSALAKHAYVFVQAMFDSTGGFFYTGTQGDLITINPYPIPEDVQTWSYLALQDKKYGVSIDWVKTNLVTIDTPSSPSSALKGMGNVRIEGETFDTASLATSGHDPEAVWLEGNAHTVAALLARRLESQNDIPFYSGDSHTALKLLKNLKFAQSILGIGQKVNGVALTPGQGIVAATGNLDTGFGFDYFPNLHIGASGWYAIALNAANPFQLGLHTDNL